jgi:hypothetical protein
MKIALLFIHDDDSQEARLQTALDLTRVLDGHLSCLNVRIPAIALPYPADEGIALTEWAMQEDRRIELNRARVEARLALEGVAWDWADAVCLAADAIDEAAGLAPVQPPRRARAHRGLEHWSACRRARRRSWLWHRYRPRARRAAWRHIRTGPRRSW